MDDRIGALHLRYRVGRGAAVPPALDRTLRAGLAKLLGASLSAVMRDDVSVVVIRELRARVALGTHEAAFDSRLVERVCDSFADAAAALLAGGADDAVMRFADDTEFVGSFIVDLLAGSAWERWYYGAFHRYRRNDARDTLRAVLELSGVAVESVFAWLSRLGRLDAVLALLGARDARRLLAAAPAVADARDPGGGDAVLAAAAMQLLAPLGAPPALLPAPGELLSQFLATAPPTADWTDRRSLSAWVLAFVRFVQGLPQWTAAAVATDTSALRVLLTGPLDWLDAPWLIARLPAPARGPAGPPSLVPSVARPMLTPRQQRILRGLAQRLRAVDLRIAANDGDDALIVRLVAAASPAGSASDGLDRAVLAAIDHAVRAAGAIVAARAGGPAGGIDVDGDDNGDEAAGGATEVAQHGRGTARRPVDAAAELRRALVAARAASLSSGEPTPAAGLYLMTRAVLDLRVVASARRLGVPVEPLLAGLATKWVGAAPPFDPAVALWTGGDRPAPGDLDASFTALRALNASLLALAIDRRALQSDTAADSVATDAALLTHRLEGSAQVDAEVSVTASLLLRDWGRWLPGIGSASPPFLLDHCVRRAGRVYIGAARADVELNPAAFDVVLQMAGYFSPIEQVPWLGDRSVTFTVRREADR